MQLDLVEKTAKEKVSKSFLVLLLADYARRNSEHPIAWLEKLDTDELFILDGHDFSSEIPKASLEEYRTIEKKYTCEIINDSIQFLRNAKEPCP